MNITNHCKDRPQTNCETKAHFANQIDRFLQLIMSRPLKHESILERLVEEAMDEKNVLSILLFGSVASGTHNWKSDIDLIYIYETHEPPWGVVERYVDGVLVQYFFTILDTLVENQETVPYLLYIFCDGKILYDRTGAVAQIVDHLKRYFATHPEMESEWLRLKELHQEEKKGPECAQKTIVQRWDELEDKYSGGIRKRTFFRM